MGCGEIFTVPLVCDKRFAGNFKIFNEFHDNYLSYIKTKLVGLNERKKQIVLKKMEGQHFKSLDTNQTPSQVGEASNLLSPKDMSISLGISPRDNPFSRSALLTPLVITHVGRSR